MRHKLLLLVGILLMVLTSVQTAVADQKARIRIVPSMMVHLQSMEKTVQSAQPRTTEDHKLIAESLEKDLSALLGNCTMRGEAHDALHDWLVPVMQDVQSYGDSTSLDEQVACLQSLREAFETFRIRFE